MNEWINTNYLPGVPGRFRFRLDGFEEVGLGFEIGCWMKVERDEGDDNKSSPDIVFFTDQ